MLLISCLSLLGAHARLCLPLGILIALILPDMNSHIRHFVPFIIVMIYASAMIRLDLWEALQGALRPRRILQNIGLSLGILVLVPCLFFIIAQGLGLSDEFVSVLVWYAVAPPIASTVWMCLLLGFRPVLAMELVVITSLLAPFTGPFLGNLFLTDVVSLNSFDLFVRLALMIVGGTGLAVIGQFALGRQRIIKNESAFDGLSTIAMLLFLIPVFNGISTQIATTPYMAIQLLSLAVLVNFGSQLFIISAAFLFQKKHIRDSLNVMAVITGNRNVGLYYAALPHDPVMSLFTAMYQVPLYLTPLFLGWLSRYSNTKQ
ncbi:MAG: hypothetical protein ACON4Q_03735 [Candidatus Puniceispirillaceae bacterium]